MRRPTRRSPCSSILRQYSAASDARRRRRRRLVNRRDAVPRRDDDDVARRRRVRRARVQGLVGRLVRHAVNRRGGGGRGATPAELGGFARRRRVAAAAAAVAAAVFVFVLRERRVERFQRHRPQLSSSSSAFRVVRQRLLSRQRALQRRALVAQRGVLALERRASRRQLAPLLAESLHEHARDVRRVSVRVSSARARVVRVGGEEERRRRASHLALVLGVSRLPRRRRRVRTLGRLLGGLLGPRIFSLLRRVARGARRLRAEPQLGAVLTQDVRARGLARDAAEGVHVLAAYRARARRVASAHRSDRRRATV
eukprot:31533-Pelagococcus_subviridis.AAC.1